MTIMIRSNIGILLTHRVHPIPSAKYRVVLACSVIVGVQSVHQVQLLAVVFVRLDILLGANVSNDATEGVVVCLLLEIAAGIHHLTDVPLVVLVVVEQRIAVGCGVYPLCLGIATVKEHHQQKEQNPNMS